MSLHSDIPSDDDVGRLQRELRIVQRQLAQAQRLAVTSETMADRSKRAMLRIHEEQN